MIESALRKVKVQTQDTAKAQDGDDAEPAEQEESEEEIQEIDPPLDEQVQFFNTSCKLHALLVLNFTWRPILNFKPRPIKKMTGLSAWCSSRIWRSKRMACSGQKNVLQVPASSVQEITLCHYCLKIGIWKILWSSPMFGPP